ncbi:ABC transporter ATP-binding protein [Frankia sp. AgB1.9]|uniref:ABC transporter ATP-binding protein n=1 Tax=unclassified Frankia TaxID=2632575 RepID=UPI001931A2DE|nr:MULTISPECIES: ABC transporter ATP-binding protein [unclassified Frankia]MBL7494006.1 ABC transporter ATP-binding protein [Frankia sp. AgW1.1]MBL7549260.1 ABC transporter ATP-binding protein [Frankia sp. AgB1.9]MBL7619476.1 ABC transporter ATP-binding protein [Frankia sp. AgB1.8]
MSASELAGPAPRHRPHNRLRLILWYTAGFRARLALGSVLTLAGTALSLSQPIVAQRILNRLARHQPTGALLLILAGAVVLGTAVGGVGYFFVESVGESLVRTVRRLLVTRILRMRPAVADRIPPADLLSRLVADTTLLRQVTTQAMVASVTAVLALLGSLVLMGLIDYVLLAVTLSAVVTMSVSVRWAAARIGAATGKAQEAVAYLAMLLDRDLGAFQTVKAAGAEAHEIGLLTDAADTAWRRGLRVAGWQAASGASAGLLMQTSFLAVLGVGGARVAAGRLPLADLIAYLLYMFFLTQPVTTLVGAWGQLKVGGAAAERIQEVLRLAAEPEPATAAATVGTVDGRALAALAARTRTRFGERGHGPFPSGGNGTVRPRADPGRAGLSATVAFEHVVFGYRPDLPLVHQGVTFTVPPGGTTAVVGPSGAGKSSLFALLERFHEVTSGRVLLDGRDVRDWPLAELRRAIGYVEQDSPVLAGTLRDNLTLGLSEVTDERLWEVVALARLEDLVQTLPGGLDGWIGHRGGTLSGGQRQRIAIGRAFLRRPRLLLLDEATSALDAVNEAALRTTLETAAKTTTVIVVAHRLSTVVNARQIVVLEAGRVRAVGTHSELLDADPTYRELATNQLLAASP